jgi:hypothetical protein
MNSATVKLHTDGFLVFENVFDDSDPGLQCLQTFASQIRSQQVCLEIDEIREHSSDPMTVMKATADFRSHVIELFSVRLIVVSKN